MKNKFVEGYSDRYTVYEDGTMFSNYRYRYRRNQTYKRVEEHRKLKPHKTRKGYLMVSLSDPVSGVRKFVPLHRIVAKAFIDNPDNKPCVCHKDNNKENCNADNLYWGTNHENVLQAWKDGLNDWKKVAVNQYNLNGEFIKKYETVTKAAEAVGVTKHQVSKCINGKAKTAGGYLWKRCTPEESGNRIVEILTGGKNG